MEELSYRTLPSNPLRSGIIFSPVDRKWKDTLSLLTPNNGGRKKVWAIYSMYVSCLQVCEKKNSQVLCGCAVPGSLRQRYRFHNISNSVAHRQHQNLSLSRYSGRHRKIFQSIIAVSSSLVWNSLLFHVRPHKYIHVIIRQFQTWQTTKHFASWWHLFQRFIPHKAWCLHIKQMKNG